MIAVLFGTFDSRHAANVLLRADLIRARVEVRLCHEPLWQATRDKHAGYFRPASLLRLGWQWLRAALKLALRFRHAAAGADCVLVGFNGQLDVLLARLLAGRRRLVFVPLVTLTETLVEDRGVYIREGLGARLLRFADRLSLRAADRVVVDTRTHADWIVRELGIDPEQLRVCPLGAEDFFLPATHAGAEALAPDPVTERASGVGERLAAVAGQTRGATLRVLGYSSFLPLHGFDVVAAAARLLAADEGIAIELVGSGPEHAKVVAQAGDLPQVDFIDWLPYPDLLERIRRADVVLGIFGSSVKARMVIPNKVYQAAQIGRAVLTADTPAIREIFVPGESIEVCEPTAEALAGALRALAAESFRLAGLGEAGRLAVARSAGPKRRAALLREILEGA